jgi:hypothetical protein
MMTGERDVKLRRMWQTAWLSSWSKMVFERNLGKKAWTFRRTANSSSTVM